MRKRKFHTFTLMDMYWEMKKIFLYAIPFLIIAGLIAFVPKIGDALAEKKAISDINAGNYDSFYRDVSYFYTPGEEDTFDQTNYGKIVSFTGVVSERSRYGEQGDSCVYIDSTKNYMTCACCEFDDVTARELGIVFNEGDQIRIIGEVYHLNKIVYLRHCKIADVEYY